MDAEITLLALVTDVASGAYFEDVRGAVVAVGSAVDADAVYLACKSG